MKTEKRRFSAGFSLVEIMVGLTIGLITVLVVSQVMQVAGARKSASVSGADSIINASLGLYTVERDGKNAGYGITVNRSNLGCEIRYQHDTGPVEEFVLAPAQIVDGADGAPDSVRFLASNKNGVPLPMRITEPHPKTAANFFVDSDLGVAAGDLMIAVPAVLNTATPATTWCLVFQAGSQAAGGGNGNAQGGGQGQNMVLHPAGQSTLNQGGNPNFPDAGYTTGDTLLNLGSLSDNTYSITRTNGTFYLHLTDFELATNTSAELDLFPNIVQLQAVYGKLNAVGVMEWNATAPATPADWQQVRAVRVAIVARGQSIQPGNVTLDGNAAASSCASANPHPAAVCWRPDPGGDGVTINVNVGDANPNWQRYQYRVLETTVPMRNVVWQG